MIFLYNHILFFNKRKERLRNVNKKCNKLKYQEEYLNIIKSNM